MFYPFRYIKGIIMDIEITKLYHFVAKEEMKNKIMNFSNEMNLDRSKSIRLIIDTMLPLLDYYTVFEEESGEFGYNEIDAEVDIRFYINPNIYRKLKNAHGVMHTFSIAVLVRKMIELFFIIIEVKSFEWLQDRMKNGIKKIIKILSNIGGFQKNTGNMIHMYGEEVMEGHIVMLFSKNYTLLKVDLAKKYLFYKH
jgi:hypothetical protein